MLISTSTLKRQAIHTKDSAMTVQQPTAFTTRALGWGGESENEQLQCSSQIMGSGGEEDRGWRGSFFLTNQNLGYLIFLPLADRRREKGRGDVDSN